MATQRGAAGVRSGHRVLGGRHSEELIADRIALTPAEVAALVTPSGTHRALSYWCLMT